MLKTVVIPHHNDYVMTLPNEYLDRQIEILVFPVDFSHNDQEAPQPLRLTALDRERREETLSAEEAAEEQEFGETFGSWQDHRPVKKIIEDIYSARTPSEEQAQIAKAVAAVRETWATIPLDQKTAIYIAEV